MHFQGFFAEQTTTSAGTLLKRQELKLKKTKENIQKTDFIIWSRDF